MTESEPTIVGNPFALMIDPEAVFAAIERSERLARLHSTICHPLDKPRPAAPPPEVQDFDQQVDAVLIEPTGFGDPTNFGEP